MRETPPWGFSSSGRALIGGGLPRRNRAGEILDDEREFSPSRTGLRWARGFLSFWERTEVRRGLGEVLSVWEGVRGKVRETPPWGFSSSRKALIGGGLPRRNRAGEILDDEREFSPSRTGLRWAREFLSFWERTEVRRGLGEVLSVWEGVKRG